MQIDPNQPDETLDQLLAALRNAAPPDNMHTRISQRLQHPASIPTPSRLRSFLLGRMPNAAWTRGALTGAAFATALTLCVTLLQHKSSTPPPTPALAPIATPQPTNVNLLTQRTPTSGPQTIPCAKATTTLIPPTEPASISKELHADTRLEAIAPSHPAPALPLTPQERQLIRLVRTASPAELATLNPEIEAKRDAEEAANFQKFFAPPPPPSDSDTQSESPRTPPPMVNE